MQELLDALNRLKEALDRAERRMEAGNAASITQGAIAGGLVGGAGWPPMDDPYLDTLSFEALGEWGDTMETAAHEHEWEEA